MFNKKEERDLVIGIAAVIAGHIAAWEARQTRSSHYYQTKTGELNWEWVMRAVNDVIANSNLEDQVERQLRKSGLKTSISWD